MGSTTSCSSSDKNQVNEVKKNNSRLYNLLNVQSDYNTEHNTINFSRKDLFNTLSDRSIIDVMHSGGGDKLRNIPKRDRYSQYETQKIKNQNQNLIGGGQLDQFSSVSEAEFNGLKKLVMSGAGQVSGKCNCGENSVLNLNGGAVLSCSYNPLNSITSTELVDQNGGECGSATSSYMPSQVGSALMSATSVSNTAFNTVLNGNQYDNSATSSYMPSQVGSALMSATSVTASSNTLVASDNSINSNIARLQRLTNAINGGGMDALSATSVSSMSTVSRTNENILNGGDVAVNSESSMSTVSRTNENLLNGGGNVLSATSLSSMSTVSRTSENAINYNDLVGGGEGPDLETDGKSSSSTSTEPTTNETESTVKNTESRLERLASVSNSDSRSSRASSTSSSNTSGSSSSSTPGSGSSSSTSYRSSDSSSTSSKSTSENPTITQQKYVLSSMSEGNVIDAKQFYSSDYGELYSSDNNYLRHNLTKRRFR